MLGAPDIKQSLALRYEGAAWVLLVVPIALATVLEAPLLVFSDRWPRKRTVVLALLSQALCLALAASAAGAWTLALALALWGTGAGLAQGVAQAALMDAYPHQRERIMTRWTILGSLGDAAAPGLMAAAHALGGSWRWALAGAAAMYAAHALVIASLPAPAKAKDAPGGSDDEPEAEPLMASLRAGVTHGRLMMWLAATALCTLLDEILVAFGSLFLRDEAGASASEQAAAFSAFAMGGVVGLLLTDRVLAKHSPRRVLLAASAICVAAYAGWLALAATPVGLPLLMIVGASVTPLYPLCEAQSYAAFPSRPGVVAGLSKLFAPLDLLAPLAIGLVADHLSLTLALAILAAQPLGIFAIARSRRSWSLSPPDPPS